jgi:hypothetical protein
MIYHIVFWTLCAVLTAHVVVAVISLTKTYRDEGKLLFFRPTFRRASRHHKGLHLLS